MVVLHEELRRGPLGWVWSGGIDGGGCEGWGVVEDKKNGRLVGVRVATLRELAAVGVSPDQVRRMVKKGRLVPLRRGVYASAGQVAAAAGNRRQAHALQVAAVLASFDLPAAGSHRSAALIHELDLIKRRRTEGVAVTRSPCAHGSHSLRSGATIHLADLPARHLIDWRGVVLTSVARTVVDLARTCSFAEGVVVADSALRMRKTTVAEMRAVVTECGRWPGVKRAREVEAFSDGRSESALESIGRVVFREYGLPPPGLQVEVGGDLGVIGRSDYLWPEYATIAEADGALKYTSPDRAIRQLDRDARLRDAGFEVVHFTWQEITIVPEQVVARIRAAFTRQRALAQS